MKSYVLLALVLLSIIKSVSALDCYKCNGFFDHDCNEADKLGRKLIKCDASWSDSCLLFTVEYDIGKGMQLVNVRDCFVSRGYYNETFSYRVSAKVCGEDKCNDGEGNESPVTTPVESPSCYECNSYEDPFCGEDNVPSSKALTYCNSKLYGIYDSCVKSVINIQGYKVTTRECGITYGEEPGCSKINPSDPSEKYCVCKDDGCNGSLIQTSSMIGTSVFVLLSAYANFF